MARYSFSGSIPPKFEHKLRRHKQRFGKIAATVVSDKNENLLSLGFQRHRSCHRNEMTLLPVLLAEVYVGTGNCSAKIVHGNFFLQQPPRCLWSLSEICKSVIGIFWDEVLMVRNTVKMDSLDATLQDAGCILWTHYSQFRHVWIIRIKVLSAHVRD